MAPLKQSRWRATFSIGALLLLLLAIFSLLRQPVAAQPSLVEARRIWMLQPPERYQLSVIQQTVRGSCEFEALVDGEQVVELANDCGNPTQWTVPQLFRWLAELEREQTRCYPSTNMCACYGASTTRIDYDPERGFPRLVEYEWRKRPNLTNAAFYRSLFDQSFPGCFKDGTGGPVLYTIKLNDVP
jgi:hypothetical protein